MCKIDFIIQNRADNLPVRFTFNKVSHPKKEFTLIKELNDTSLPVEPG